MLSSDVENPFPNSDLNSLAVVVPSSSPGDGSDLSRSEHCEGAASAPASDPPRTTTNNFSIREYVFRSRSKDIYSNWPFSRKNLQLCLQHGVTEVLPPFRHLDTARCGPFEIPKFEIRSVDGKDCVAKFKSEPFSSKPKGPSLRGLDRATELNADGVASNEQLSSVQSSTKDDVPLVAFRVSQVTVEQAPAEELIPPTCLKSESLAQAAGKKCKFIVKFGTKSERSLGDDTVSNCTSFSENMASKICPVCKTFSSSSNTTLNAHIDQCLSMESVPHRLSIRQRIKPRKTRLMVDIYETALRCTIEELNRRNGLNWANPSSLPAPNADVSSEEERRPSTPLVRADIPSGAGAIYIDANGTKLRILSKFNDDPPELRSAKDELSKKSSRGKQGNGIFKKKTKKLHRQKHYKYLKLVSKGKKLHSQKARESQFFAKQKNLHGTQEGSEGSQGRSQLSLGPLKPGLSGTLKLWSSSKRTSPKKKFAKKGENPQRCQLHLAPSLLVEDDQNKTSLVGRTPMRHCTPNLLDTSENSDYSRSFDSEKERSWPDFRDLESEEPVICERSLAWSDVTPDSVEKWGYPPAKRKLPKEDHFREVDISNIRKNTGHGKLQLRHKKGIEVHAVVGGCDRTLGNISERQLRPRPSATKALRFSTPRKRALSLCQSSENSSDISAGKKEFSFKKLKLHLTEDPAQDQSVEEGTNFEFSSGESSERETIGLCEDAETRDLHGKVQYTKSTLNDACDNEPSVDALEDCAWGLSKYYELPQLKLRAYDACDAVNEKNADDGEEDECYDAGQSSSFIEIDPIPIPGPPGSFLPSPGAMGLDDFQGTSSLTTSQAQSSHDQEDLVDRDALDSPISATSTVSNSTEAKVGMDYSEELVSGGRPLLPEDTWVAFSSAGNNAFPIQHAPSAAALTSCSTLVETIGRANNVSIKKGPPFTRDGNEPCCCQKKAREVSQIGVLDYREMESPSLTRVPPVAVPGATGQTVEIPSGGSRSDEGYEGSIPTVAKSSNILPSSRSFGEFPNGSGRADCDFPSPSGSSNPVLRLMGKDLIVVNKDAAAGIPDRSQSSALAPFKSQDSQPIAIRGISHESSQKQDSLYKDMNYSPAHSFFTGSSSGYSGIITMPVTVRAPKPVPVSTFINPKIASDFTASMMGPKYDGGLHSSVQFDTAKVKPVGPSKQMMHEVAPLTNPGKAMMVTDDESGKESGYTLCAVNDMNFPRDAVLLPNSSRGTSALSAVYQTREPVAELTGSYPRGVVFINGKTRGPFVAAPPAFLGYQGSGYVYYPSYS